MSTNQLKQERRKNLGYLFVFLAGAGWGTGGSFVTRLGQLGMSSTMAGFTSHFLALPILALVILIANGWQGFRISKRGFLYCLIMGVVTKGFFLFANNLAISIVGVSTASVLLYTAPVFVTILSVLIFRERLYANNYIALALNLIGVFMVVTLGNLSNLNAKPLGIGLGLTAAFLHALNTIMAKMAGNEDNAVTKTFYMLVFSSLTQALLAQPWTGENLALLNDPRIVFWMILNAILTGAICNLLYIQGMATGIDASKAPVISSVEVIVANILGVVLFSEPMNWIGILGIFLMVFSIYLMNKPPRQAMKEEY